MAAAFKRPLPQAVVDKIKSGDNEPIERQARDLTPGERRVRTWIKTNHGVLSKVARACAEDGHQVSVSFVQRIAYNREAKSKGMIVERKLHDLGCPLMQKIK